MNSVVVTALYDIGREEYDGRSMNDYLKWFDKTLDLSCPKIVFTESKFIDFLYSKKRPCGMQIIEQPLEKVPYYKYVDDISNVLNDENYRKTIIDPGRIECNLPLYNVIQYSKFDWLLQASRLSYNFNADMLFWMDAGCSRFFGNLNLNRKWPQKNFFSDNQLYIQGNVNTEKYLGRPYSILENNCILVGTLFGAHKNIIEYIATLIRKEFEHYLYYENIVNNEQILLGVLLQQYSSLFNVYIKLNNEHLPFLESLS